MNTELQDALERCLAAAEAVDAELLSAEPSHGFSVEPAITARIEWIKRQIMNLTAKLVAMREDMEVGLSLTEMGFADTQEMQDLLDDMTIQIAQLMGMCHALSKGLGLGI